MAFSVCKTIPFTSSFYCNYNNSNSSRQQAVTRRRTTTTSVVKCAIERSSSNTDGKKVVSNSNYVVPIDDSFSFSNSSSCITRPLAEILRDLNKRIPDTLVKPPPPLDPSSSSASSSTFIPWYHANRMLSFYAPGWCGEIRDVIFSDNGTVTVVYRLTVRGSDGEAYRESTGTVSTTDGSITDPVSAAEENAFCKACARFGLGLYLYHDDQTTSM
ncbi:cobalt ion binding protein [Trifolium repens]|nr:cobalt ion binding protein [Trifolium repens]